MELEHKRVRPKGKAKTGPRSIKPKSSKRDDIIEFIYKTNLVPNYAARLLELDVNDDLYKDYVGDIWLQICEVKQEKWDMLYEQGSPAITAFVSGLIHRNCKSINSPAYWHLKRPNLNMVHLKDENWEILDETGELGWKITEEEQNPWRDKKRNEEDKRRRTQEDDNSEYGG